jgi:hypothetical protein
MSARAVALDLMLELALVGDLALCHIDFRGFGGFADSRFGFGLGGGFGFGHGGSGAGGSGAGDGGWVVGAAGFGYCGFGGIPGALR